jgi:hypothetical protein
MFRFHGLRSAPMRLLLLQLTCGSASFA